MAGFESIFTTPLGQTVLLFLLIFTIVFAILQKSKILGEGKKQIDALVALAIGLLVCGVGYVLQFTQQIIPFMAVVMIIILVFLILTAMFWPGEIDMHKNIRTGFGVLVFIVVIIAVLVFTGAWDAIKQWFGDGQGIASNVILVVIVLAVIAFAYFGGGKEKKEEKKP